MRKNSKHTLDAKEEMSQNYKSLFLRNGMNYPVE